MHFVTSVERIDVLYDLLPILWAMKIVFAVYRNVNFGLVHNMKRFYERGF